MRFAVLGSGSGGNATVVESGGEVVLIDAGLSAKQLTLRLKMLGIEAGDLSAILLTHEHGDHVRGLDVFLRQNELPVFATTQTSRVMREKLRQPADWQLFQTGQGFSVGEFEVRSFRLPHDAVEPVGYVLGRNEMQVAVATDLGHADSAVMEALTGVQGILLEANYEWKMLENDLRRPFSLKQRISSKHGHLSNQQAAELIEQLIPHGLQKVVLGHLSSDCNQPDTAMRVICDHLGEHCLTLCCADQHEPTPWQKITPEQQPRPGELFFFEE